MSETKVVARMDPETRILHAFLKERSRTFKARKGPALDVFELVVLLDAALEDALRGRWNDSAVAIGALPLYREFLSLPRNAGHEKHLRALIGAQDDRDPRRFATHMARLRRIVKIVANDDPLKDGDHVKIIRTEHGWFDGSIIGVVRGGSVVDADGGAHRIRHRRDVVRVSE